MNYVNNPQGGLDASNDEFFTGAITEGVGNESENLNPDISESLHSGDRSMSWQRNPQELGNKIINFPGDALKEPESSQSTTDNLGTIVSNVTPENNNSVDELQYNKDAVNETGFDRTNIKTTGDGLDTAGIKELEKLADRKLYKEDDAAGYVDTIRGEDGMTFANLENTYGSNSAWKKAA